jgi:hypothetical protein
MYSMPTMRGHFDLSCVSEEKNPLVIYQCHVRDKARSANSTANKKGPTEIATRNVAVHLTTFIKCI